MKNFNQILSILLIIFVFSTTIQAQTDSKKITLDDIWKNWTFYASSVSGIRSMNDGKHYTTLSRTGEIEKFRYEDGEKVSTIVATKDLGISVDDYEFNADETKILFQTDYKRIYRRSFTANYYIYEIQTKKLTKLSENGKQQIASFSPNGKKVAFIRENNMFIKDLDSGNEKQITTDGKHNEIINGIPDWVYEEEFSFNKAYVWLPDSKQLAYIKFDESKVKMFNMTVYAGQFPKHKDNILYPENQSFKYPKAGEDNSKISVHIYNLDSEKTTNVNIGEETDIYIPRIQATTKAGELAIFRLNRLQNHFEILIANTKTGKTKLLYEEKNKRYIAESNFDNVKFLDGGKYFVTTSENDAYMHLYLYNMKGKLVKQLTKGTNEVTNFYGYDAENKLFYYQAVDNSPLRRGIFSVSLKKAKITKLSTQLGTNEAVFSNNFKYYINYFSSVTTPNMVTLYNSDGKQIRELKNNNQLLEKAKTYACSQKEFFTIKTSEGVELNASILKPLNFDKNKKYPIILHQYSGPGSQEVLDKWDFAVDYAWEQMLVQEGAIYIEVDPRGTGGRGEDFRKVTYLELGKYESIDLIEVAKYLKKQTWVNPEKIGVWGWSFGGFMTSLCMTKGNKEFAAGIAVAPVTNWKYYDNIYTERYMRTPKENNDGYENNSPINFADKLEKPFLLVHGTADDNVHFQNSVEFSEALVQANKYYEQFFYTNRNHSIYGGNTRYHLWNTMYHFWKRNIL